MIWVKGGRQQGGDDRRSAGFEGADRRCSDGGATQALLPPKVHMQRGGAGLATQLGSALAHTLPLLASSCRRW